MYLYIILELIFVALSAIINFKTKNIEKLNKSMYSSYIVFLLIALKYVFLNNTDVNELLIFLKAIILIGSFLFYATYYIIYLKDKDNIELAQKTLRLARINHFVCVVLLAGILYYEYSFAK